MAREHEDSDVEALAGRLPEVDWEPRVREQPFRPAPRRGRLGL